jgi:hypothetical protein
MSYGPTQYFLATIASGTSTSVGLELGGKSYRNMAVYTSGVSGAMALWASYDGTTYKAVHERVNTASVQWAAVLFPSTVSGVWASTPMPPAKYVQFVATGTCANGATIHIAVDD